MSEKKHYYLAAATVKYRKRHMEFTSDLNSLIILDTQIITQNVLGHIQQVTQVRFFRSVEQPSPEVNVDDIYINNIIYLGFMTEEEWAFVPPPPKPQEVQSVVDKIMSEAKAHGITPDAPPEAAPPVPVAEEPVDAPVAPVATPAPAEPPPYLDIDPPDAPVDPRYGTDDSNKNADKRDE